jgi:hypothetical protein
MGLLDKITGTISAVNKKTREIDEKNALKKKEAAKDLRFKRQKFAPIISKIAKEYQAGVEILDSSAYVSKSVRGEERGVHIPYGIDPVDIRNRLDKSFLARSTTEKAKSFGKSIEKAVKTGKEIKKALGNSGIKGGGMWEQQMKGGGGGGLGSRNNGETPFSGRPPGW